MDKFRDSKWWSIIHLLTWLRRNDNFFKAELLVNEKYFKIFRFQNIYDNLSLKKILFEKF